MKILVIKSHPRKESFCHSLADRYIEGAIKSGNRVEDIVLSDLNLEHYLKEGHKEKVSLSDDLLSAQQAISLCDRLVFAFPTWWTTPPALLKLFIEIIFLPGFAYKYHKKEGLTVSWDKLLKGKSARLFVTMDAPPFYYKLVVGNPSYKMMKGTLGFCGIKPIRCNYFGSVKMSSENKKIKWLQKAYKVGMA